MFTQLNTFISLGVGNPRLLHGRDVDKGGFWRACSHVPSSLYLLPRLPSKSFPHLPGTPRPAPSTPPGPVKAAPAQVRPPSPGNIRPVKREVRVEPERKETEKEPQKVSSEPSLKGRTPLVKVEEAAVEEATGVEAEAAPGRKPLTGRSLVAACTLLSPALLFLGPSSSLPPSLPSFPSLLLFWALGNFTLRLIWRPFLKYNFLTYKEGIIHPTAYC